MDLTTNALITRCVLENDFNKLLIIPYHMWDQNEKRYIDYIKKYLNEYKRFPTYELFLDNNPAFRVDMLDSEIPNDYIFDEVSTALSKGYIKRKLTDDASMGIDVYNTDYLRKLSDESRIPPREMLIWNFISTDTYKKDIIRYSFGSTSIDGLTQGLLSNDFIFFAARMKMGKTFVLNMLQILLWKQGIRSAAFSNELNLLQYSGRLDSLLGNFNPIVFRTLEFDKVQKQLDEAQEKRMNSSTPLYLFGPLRNIHDLVSTVQVFPIEQRPQVIFVDSFNLSSRSGRTSDEKSLDVANTNAFARDFINDFKIPIIATIQNNRSGASGDPDTTSVAMSDDYGRICDAMFGLSPAELNGGIKATKINCIAGRGIDAKPLWYTINWDKMSFDFRQNIEEPQAAINFNDE